VIVRSANGRASCGKAGVKFDRPQEDVDLGEVAAPGRARCHAPVLLLDEPYVSITPSTVMFSVTTSLRAICIITPCISQ
jgi:hypothetical protein